MKWYHWLFVFVFMGMFAFLSLFLIAFGVGMIVFERNWFLSIILFSQGCFSGYLVFRTYLEAKEHERWVYYRFGPR